MDVLINVLLMIGGAVTVFFFGRSIFGMLFSMDSQRQYQKRMRQLQFTNEGESQSDGTADAINTVTTPIIRYVLPKLRPRDKEQLAKDLKIAGWDKTYSPDQFIAMNILLKMIGVVLGGAVGFLVSPLLGGILFLALFFGFTFLFNNSLKEKKTKIFREFPNFIRIVQGYLTAGIPIAKAIEQSLPYMSPEWQKIMKNFVINTNLSSVQDAIVILNQEVDIFEVQEFFSLIRLNLEQGINIKESFEGQREKVIDMQLEVMLEAIGRRQMMATILQGPLLLTMIVGFGLPIFYSMFTFTSV
ncbi:type II secretion system F family protein [Rossellomorea marisflavi]|uniref:type II secretion system F family protein n=1 Tax=Rossellomorea marisflavi TaxID=189381 RepID=UPI003FA0A2F7